MTWCRVSSLSTPCTRGTSPRRRSPSPRAPPRTRRSSSPSCTPGSCSSLLPRRWLSTRSMVSTLSRLDRARHHRTLARCWVRHRAGQSQGPRPRSAGPRRSAPWSSPRRHTRRCTGTRAPTPPSRDTPSHCSSHSPPSRQDRGRRAQSRYRPPSGPGIQSQFRTIAWMLG